MSNKYFKVTGYGLLTVGVTIGVFSYMYPSTITALIAGIGSGVGYILGYGLSMQSIQSIEEVIEAEGGETIIKPDREGITHRNYDIQISPADGAFAVKHYKGDPQAVKDAFFSFRDKGIIPENEVDKVDKLYQGVLKGRKPMGDVFKHMIGCIRRYSDLK